MKKLTISDFKDAVSGMVHGMTKAEAHAKGICIDCKQPPIFRNETEEKEYRISGICGPCWDKTFSEEES